MPAPPVPVTVLVMAPRLGADLNYVAAGGEEGSGDAHDGDGGRSVAGDVVVLDGNDAYLAELRDGGWSFAAPSRPWTSGERAELLAGAEVLVVGYPVPLDLASRMPRLRWAHHVQAGVSNLHRTDLWSSDVVLTSGRGTVSVRAIAEYAIAAVLHFARGLNEAAGQKRAGSFTRRGYRMRTVEGATMGIVGLGGIGTEVGRLARSLGMTVVATRRSIDEPQHDVDGADEVLPADRLLEVAARSDYLVVCSQLTEETRGLIGADVIDALPPGAVLVNIARGEEVDEDALVAALAQGRLGGAVLDVHHGELDGRPPRPELLDSPLVLLTPHVSGMAGEVDAEPGRRLVAENVRRYLRGQPLLNEVDRARGY